MATDLEKWHGLLRPALIKFFSRQLRSSADAEDLTQEVFIRLACARVEIARPRFFAYRIAQNLLRDRARHELIRFQHRSEVAHREEDRTDCDPARVLIGRESLAVVDDVLSALPDRTRRIFLLYRLENLRRAEIASLFGVTVSAVEKHIARAAAHLPASS